MSKQEEQPQREKNWSELDDGEKIERLRRMLRQTMDQLDYATKTVNELRYHDHLNGKIVCPQENLISHSGTLRRFDDYI